MSPIKWLNNLLFMENLIGIYRNYCSQHRTKKYCTIFHIFVQTMMHIILVIYELFLLVGKDDYSQIKLLSAGFGFVVFVNSMSSVMIGIFYSRDFMSYYRSYSRVSECFKDNKQLQFSLKKVFCIGITFNSIFYGFAVVRPAGALIKYLPSHPKVYLVPMLLSQAIIRYTIAFQYLMLYIVVMMLVHFLVCLNSLITTVHERVKNCDISSGERCNITRKQIQGWVELYRDLANSCDKVSLCFGRQYVFSLVLTLSQYILLTYHMLYTNVYKFGDSYDSSRIAIIIFSVISVLMMPLSAGQMASNQGSKFRRVLVRLYNTMLIDAGEAETKLIKDFIRLVKENPIEIKLLSKIPAGMYMLPVVATLAGNYLIVMLQFNHVI